MGTFTASLRAIGDVHSLPATVEVEDGRLKIESGSTEIGSWALTDIHLEPIPTGYRMAAEGDQIIIEMKDVDSFTAALGNGSKKRLKLPGFGKNGSKTPEVATAPVPATPVAAAAATPAPATPAPVAPAPVAPSPAPVVTESRTERVVAMPPTAETRVENPTTKKSGKQASPGIRQKGLAFVDGTLEAASKRLGPYLPEWMFTRVMFGIVFIALILMIVLPGLISVFMLVAGALLVVLGAVVYSDSMLASRWLPGRTTPTHVLLFGVTILMLGVLLGVIAR